MNSSIIIASYSFSTALFLSSQHVEDVVHEVADDSSDDSIDS